MDAIVGDKIEIRNKNDESFLFIQDIDEEMFAGYEVICFNAEDNTISYESEK